MKEKQELSSYEKQMLNQRSIIHAMPHLVAALGAYAIEPLKLSSIKFLSNCKQSSHCWGFKNEEI